MKQAHQTKVLFALAFVALTACNKKGEPEPATPTPVPVAAPAPPVEDPPDVHIEGDHLVIDQKIHFAHDSDEILEDSFELLDHIATALNNHKEITSVHVIGHTDSSGEDAHNQDLSERRAGAVVSALKQRDVVQTLDARGAGEGEPSCAEETEECHEQNRRVEFVVER